MCKHMRKHGYSDNAAKEPLGCISRSIAKTASGGKSHQLAARASRCAAKHSEARPAALTCPSRADTKPPP